MSTRAINNTLQYPANVRKLFVPRLPFPWKEPLGYEQEDRKTCYITPLSKYKQQYSQYIEELKNIEEPEKVPTAGELEAQNAAKRRQLQKESMLRQIKEWDDPESFQKQEKEMKDPYRTVFLARLSYNLTEIQISDAFIRFGPIESIRLIRDKENNKSRGYGFLVFEKEIDAQNCIKELASTGLKLDNRTILVDMERGRLQRGWKPRRLGGGLGGRHYTKPSSMHSNTASAAASGRTLNLNIGHRPRIDRYVQRDQRDRDSRGIREAARSREFDRNRRDHISYNETHSSTSQQDEYKYTDKYAKYLMQNKRRDDRSIRSIRQRD